MLNVGWEAMAPKSGLGWLATPCYDTVRGLPNIRHPRPDSGDQG